MNDLAATFTSTDQNEDDGPEEHGSSLDARQNRAIRQIANHLHRLNHAVMEAVESGVSVELVRSARHHGGTGNWGDLMVPVIVKR